MEVGCGYICMESGCNKNAALSLVEPSHLTTSLLLHLTFEREEATAAAANNRP